MGGFPLLPEQASTMAIKVDQLYIFLTVTTIFFVVLIAALITAFSIRYRRRHADEVPQHQITGSTKLELGWTVPLLGLSMIAFGWSTVLFLEQSTPPQDAINIYVLGKQWMWKNVHEDGQSEINDLHVPVGRPVKLTMTSQDVIHSYYIPAFRIKADVVPGRYSTAWFEATKPGAYHLFCTEYCGTEHSYMIGTVYVLPEDEYQAWLDANQPGANGGPVDSGNVATPEEAGQQLFASLGCSGCHAAAGNGAGPSLVGLFGRERPLEGGETVVADETYIRESILNPQAKVAEGYQPIMPTYQGQVTEDQLLSLVTYVKSLGADQGEEENQEGGTEDSDTQNNGNAGEGEGNNAQPATTPTP